MLALLLVTETSHVRFASRDAMFSAVTPGARDDAANHAYRVLKRSVRLAVHTPSATCRVPLHATGYHVLSDARNS